MLQLREIVAYDNNGELVVILGNMRYRAMKELGYKDAPVKVLPTGTSAKKLRAYIQKDNIAFGQNSWDLLANDWNLEELLDFGLECEFLKISKILIWMICLRKKKIKQKKMNNIIIPLSCKLKSLKLIQRKLKI